MASAQDILSLKSPLLEFLSGNLAAQSSKVLPPETLQIGSLVFVAKAQDLIKAVEGKAHIIIALKKIIPAAESMPKLGSEQALFSTSNISQAMGVVLPLFDQKGQDWPPGVHPTAVVHPSAKLGKSVSIGAYSIIESGVHIGDHTKIDHHVVIKRNAKLGANCLLHGFVYVGSESELGARVEIQPHATIGSDGYGYYKDSKGENCKIPQIGKVTLEDDVVIGAGSCIDRATLTETRIGKGTKLDNLCHIAHNVKLGRQGFFTAGFMTAGSIEVGDNFACGGQVGVADHIKITDNVTLAGKTGVTRNISEPGAYIGYPVEPMSQGMRTLATLPKISEMKKDIAEIKKALKLS